MPTERMLLEKANSIRQCSLITIRETGAGHIGGDLSAADFLTTLYFGGILNVDPQKPNDPGRDRFIMSKGHCSALLYTVLAFAGFFPEEELRTYMQPLSRLNGHPNIHVPGVEACTGPLGHGLAVGVGTALASKMDSATWRTFVLAGDGELQEGSNWEATMAAAHYELDSLTLIIDRNGLQLGDWTEKLLQLEPLAEKWRAFGWSIREVHGHDLLALIDTFQCTSYRSSSRWSSSYVRRFPGSQRRSPPACDAGVVLRAESITKVFPGTVALDEVKPIEHHYTRAGWNGTSRNSMVEGRKPLSARSSICTDRPRPV